MATDIMRHAYSAEDSTRIQQAEPTSARARRNVRNVNAVLVAIGAFCLAGFVVSTIVYYVQDWLPVRLQGELLPTVVACLAGSVVAFHEMRKAK